MSPVFVVLPIYFFFTQQYIQQPNISNTTKSTRTTPIVAPTAIPTGLTNGFDKSSIFVEELLFVIEITGSITIGELQENKWTYQC